MQVTQIKALYNFFKAYFTLQPQAQPTEDT